MVMMKVLLFCGWQFNIDLCCNSYLPVATTIFLAEFYVTIFLSNLFFSKDNGLHIELKVRFHCVLQFQ